MTNRKQFVVRFRARHLLPPYLDHIERSPHFVVRIFNEGDVARLDEDQATGLLESGIIGPAAGDTVDAVVTRGNEWRLRPDGPWRTP